MYPSPDARLRVECVYSISCMLNVLYWCCNIRDAKQNFPFVVCAACCEMMTCHLGHLYVQCVQRSLGQHSKEVSVLQTAPEACPVFVC